jgi:thymidylate synthase (FAD)
MHWLRLRLDGHAQKEIRAYAEVVYQIFRAWLPTLAQAFDDYVSGAITFSAKELRALANTGFSVSLVKPGDHGMSAGEVAEFAAKLDRMAAAASWGAA